MITPNTSTATIVFDCSIASGVNNSYFSIVSGGPYNTTRVLCWIMTCSDNLKKKAIHVQNTWGKRCDKLLIISDETDDEFPAIGVNNTHGRDHLTAKTMKAFDYIYEHHFDDADWFMKADDDTYVIMENLKHLLSEHNTSEPIYFGHRFHVKVKQGYASGGGGYVLSQESLRRFGERSTGLCASDHGSEDVEMGRCMERLHVPIGDSHDSQGRSRFHCFTLPVHLHRQYPKWYNKYTINANVVCLSKISNYVCIYLFIYCGIKIGIMKTYQGQYFKSCTLIYTGTFL